MAKPVLYTYWRSTASWRVRIALALKGIDYEARFVNLKAGEQLEGEFAAINNEQMIPVFIDTDGTKLTQSLAILEYLDATRPDPALLPPDPALAAKTRSFALAIAADIHPIQNLRVLKYLRREFGQDQAGIDAWASHWIATGFAALEQVAASRSTQFLFGDEPAYAECFLIPQSANAIRFGLSLDSYPALNRVIAECESHPALRKASAAAQPDAE